MDKFLKEMYEFDFITRHVALTECYHFIGTKCGMNPTISVTDTNRMCLKDLTGKPLKVKPTAPFPHRRNQFLIRLTDKITKSSTIYKETSHDTQQR